ncbi:hypothetical protein VS883_27305, partial [Escherichia coli]
NAWLIWRRAIQLSQETVCKKLADGAWGYDLVGGNTSAAVCPVRADEAVNVTGALSRDSWFLLEAFWR